MALSARLRFEILERDDFTCQYCGAKAPDVKLHVDHMESRSNGGSDDPSNLITACQDCNLGKAALTLAKRENYGGVRVFAVVECAGCGFSFPVDEEDWRVFARNPLEPGVVQDWYCQACARKAVRG